MKKWSYLFALLIALEAISVTLYLGNTEKMGFPLDDAWIHQTYARNLGLHGIMASSSGIPSTGSTSFLWTLLLAAGYFLKVPFFFWTYLLGGLFAAASALTAACLSQEYFGSFRNAAIVAIICILEWHLAWAAVSGMEIGLFTFSTLMFLLLVHRKGSPFLLGGLAGILVLVRPEGIFLALIYGFHLLLTHPREIRHILPKAAAFLIVFLIVISPWIIFNITYSHRPFPNTISAKFFQYGYPWSLWKSSNYLLDVLIYFLNGPLLLLVPCAGFVIYYAVRTQNTVHFHPLAWFLALIGLYAVALPVIYDQGRYLMPLIPLIVIYGVEGFCQLLEKVVSTTLVRTTAWVMLFGMIAILWINGASDYSFRTQLFNTVHMQAAQWINDHAAGDAVIATHDIGIIGYYTERQIVDLAGLVTPEIVPIMGDPQKMANYLSSKQVSYLIVYSGYYRDLLNLIDSEVVFSPGAEELRKMNVEPFEIYEVSQ